jgi:predicted metal-dependent TIM-barrel fold hydrolase
MNFIDPHAHMSARITDDYEAMAAAGVVAVIEPAFWLGQPRTSVGSFRDYFASLVGWERFRAAQFGIRHYCCIGLNSKEANQVGLASEVMEILPLFLGKEGVVALGEIGFDDQTPAEERFFHEQLVLVESDFELPVMIHTPHRDKKAGTSRSMDVIEEHGIAPSRVIVDHNNEETVREVLDRGFWAAFTIYPQTTWSRSSSNTDPSGSSWTARPTGASAIHWAYRRPPPSCSSAGCRKSTSRLFATATPSPPTGRAER